jgi:hypothetical protein
MIEDAPEGGLNIVAVLKDVFGWISDSCTPEPAQMASKGMLIKYWGAFISIVSTWFWDRCFGGTSDVRTVRAIDANSTLAFSHGPLEWGENEAWNEIDQKAREMDMKRLCFFFDKFGLAALLIGLYGWMVIVGILSRDLVRRRCEMACERDTLGTDSECPRVVWNRIV